MFSKFRQIYAMADRLGLDMLPPSASDEEQMQNIAEQLGMDYDGTEDCEKAMLDNLYDMENGEEDPYDNGYDDDSYAEYEESQQGQERKDNKKQEKKKEEQTEETTEGGDSKKGGDNPEGGQQGEKGQNGDSQPGENGQTGQNGETVQNGEKGPNDNGYDPNRTAGEGGDGTTGGVDKPNAQNGEHGSTVAGDPNTQPANGGNGTPGKNGTPDGSNSTALTKPGETNPNLDVNKNGSSPNAGNGYNSHTAQKAKNASETGTTVGNRNYEHQQRVQRGKQAESVAESAKKATPNPAGKKPDATPKKSSGLPKKNAAQKNANAAKKKARQLKNRQRMKKLKENLVKLWGFLIRHPYLIFAIILVLLFIIIILAVITDGDVTGGGGGNGAMNCTYNLSGVTSTGDVELSGVKVELINCDGTSSEYEVLANVDFEKYVLGVALAEIGPSAPDEALKAQIVAARNFALTRNSGMCPSNPDNCFYGYNASTGKIRMRACEADQVYWDYENDIYRQDRGAISLYSPEIDSGTVWKTALNETRKAEVEALADDVKGKVLLDESGNVYKTSYNSTITDKFTEGANAGKTYDEILNEVYSGSSDISSAKCARAGNIDYGDYTLSSDGHTILHQPLDQFLEDNGTSLEEFNELIAENVEDAGFGTRAGVVAAAVTLIGELGDNYGVKVPYYWGGGHYDGVIIGAHHYWGSDPDCTTYANNQTYDYCGLDCSGFVPWAIKNGGFGMNQMLAGDFKDVRGAEKVTLKSNQAVLQPGDLLESEGHIVLVVGIDEDANQYICAEASGNQQGVLFTRRSFKDSGYWGVNMDGYYANSANIRSK